MKSFNIRQIKDSPRHRDLVSCLLDWRVTYNMDVLRLSEEDITLSAIREAINSAACNYVRTVLPPPRLSIILLVDLFLSRKAPNQEFTKAFSVGGISDRVITKLTSFFDIQ